ncbi:hypothetical protein GCM10011390_45650 [Aureimonas endophytica]|uniref:HTH arsR-type domain-containing protein n=1 Tax=Aureimonas endophytica TaxID=2027858 RepID=A0A917A1J4_9HYPH|nr:hypothetical protein GCM10011390_45650 [Aureimonas endophytica]
MAGRPSAPAGKRIVAATRSPRERQVRRQIVPDMKDAPAQGPRDLPGDRCRDLTIPAGPAPSPFPPIVWQATPSRRPAREDGRRPIAACALPRNLQWIMDCCVANETSPTPKQDVDGAVAIFTALADPARLRLLVHMARGEAAVSDLAVATGGRLTTVSARLRVLLSARLVARRRDGRSVLYRLADAHVLMLVSNALDHARETRRP